MSLNGCNNNNNPQNFGSAFPCEKIQTASAVFLFYEIQKREGLIGMGSKLNTL